ncbi:MAG: GNAT family N-acetyltransferase [Deltaproteobacteria bacterium]|nr:GNAT family N-acetyltransferase [Deltaproteobacteria bacterium]
MLFREFRKADLDAIYLMDQECHGENFRFGYRQLYKTLLDQNVWALVAEAAQGQNAEGQNAEGQNAEGQNAEGQNAEGQNAEGQAPPEEPEIPPVEEKTPADSSRRQTVIIAALIIREQPERECMSINTLMVTGEYRGLGLGRRLIGWARAAAASRGIGRLEVPLEAENEDAREFLSRCGFQDSRGCEPYFLNSAEGSVWVLDLPGQPSAPQAGQLNPVAEDQ